MAKKPERRLLAGLTFALLWADTTASAAQELPSGGGPIPPVRRGASGQIEIVRPDVAARPATGRHATVPAAVAPKPSTPGIRRDDAARVVRDTPPPPPAGQPQPEIAVTPSTPIVRDTTPRGAVVATYSVSMSDGSPFTGTVRFGAPHYDNKGVFALRDNDIIVNPNGPGLGPNKTTVTDHITLEAIPESQAGR